MTLLTVLDPFANARSVVNIRSARHLVRGPRGRQQQRVASQSLTTVVVSATYRLTGTWQPRGSARGISGKIARGVS